MRTARCLLAGALLGYAAVLMSSEPWAHEEWPEEPERDPEQGAQPDHGEPFVPAWPRKALFAGRVTQRCPRCGSKELRFGNDLSFWCGWCERHFSPPMTFEEAMAFFTDRAA